MNILHVTPYYSPAYAFGGVVRAVEGMAYAQAERRHLVTVLTTDAFSPGRRLKGPEAEVVDNVVIIRAANLIPRGKFNLSTPYGMKTIARQLIAEADVVHCHEFRTVENLIVTPIAEALGKPLVLSPHGTLTLETGRSRVKAAWDRYASRRMALRFDQIIGLTQDEADEAQAFWRQFGKPDKIIGFSVAPNAVSPEEFARPSGGDAFRERYQLGDAPVVLFMGRLHPRKGPHLLAQAFHDVAMPEARLVIAGPDEGALALVQPYIDRRVVVTGYLDPEERLAALAAADIFALPAVGEGMPVAVLEAMAAGVPVIVSPGCHMPEITAHRAGVEVPAEPGALAFALRLLLNDPKQRAEMGAAAQRLVRSRFNWESVAIRLEATYKHLPWSIQPTEA